MHGICSFSDLAQPLVARLCAQLGYPANSVEAVACARNKDLTRLALTVGGQSGGQLLRLAGAELCTRGEVASVVWVIRTGCAGSHPGGSLRRLRRRLPSPGPQLPAASLPAAVACS